MTLYSWLPLPEMDYVSIMEPQGPMIAIHKGWYHSQNRQKLEAERVLLRDQQKSPRRGGEYKNRPPKTSAQRQYQFVNATIPERTKNTDIRKLVRTHVRNDYLRNQKCKVVTPSPPSPPSLLSTSQQCEDLSVRCHSIVETLSISEAVCDEYDDNTNLPISVGYPTATAEYAIEMQPHMHALLSRYLTYVGQRVYPGKLRLQPHPLRSSEWFKLAVTDAAMLHGMLYLGAVCLALLKGWTESEHSIYHLYKTISIVNKRLESSTQIDESTIAALSCLALGEAITGNEKTWDIHMQGLKQIMRMKSGISSLDKLLIAKLHRTDIAGAIDYSLTPHLEFVRSDRPSVWSRLPEHDLQSAQRDVVRILSSCQVNPRLIEIMVDVAHFSQAILSWRTEPSTNLDPRALSEDMYWIEYRLLLYPTTLQDGLEEWKIDKACRIGALLYMKALLEEFPHSATGPSILLKQLRESLQNITVLDSLSSLLVWLSVVGTAMSKSDMRVWFMGLLTELTVNLRISSFRDHELEMSRVIGLEEVLGSSVEKLWVEATEALRARVTFLQI